MSSKRPALCPVTLRWMADTIAKDGDHHDALVNHLGIIPAYFKGVQAMRKALVARLRNLATRSEKKHDDA